MECAVLTYIRDTAQVGVRYMNIMGCCNCRKCGPVFTTLTRVHKRWRQLFFFFLVYTYPGLVIGLLVLIIMITVGVVVVVLLLKKRNWYRPEKKDLGKEDKE